MTTRAHTRIIGLALFFLAASLAPLQAMAQQVADTAFVIEHAAPTYTSEHPVVLLDEAHSNFHTLAGRYLVFGKVLRQDGYDVRSSRAPLSAATLMSARVFVIANALHPSNAGGGAHWRLPTPSAFTPAEVAAVRDWVKDGGSLLLIADHMPFPGAASELAAAFGVHMLNGFAFDSTRTQNIFTFSRAGGGLASHSITNGRNSFERVDSVTAFTGQAFRIGGSGTPLMTLARGTVVLEPRIAWEFDDKTPVEPGAGLLQGAAISYGKGRVAVFGEAAMFSAQLTAKDHAPMGMNDPKAPQNAQFLLNVMHWLSGLLPAM